MYGFALGFHGSRSLPCARSPMWAERGDFKCPLDWAPQMFRASKLRPRVLTGGRAAAPLATHSSRAGGFVRVRLFGCFAGVIVIAWRCTLSWLVCSVGLWLVWVAEGDDDSKDSRYGGVGDDAMGAWGDGPGWWAQRRICGLACARLEWWPSSLNFRKRQETIF